MRQESTPQRKPRWSVQAFGFAALVMALAFGGASEGFAKDVKIGVLVPRTGRYADTGISLIRGIEMVVKDINAKLQAFLKDNKITTSATYRCPMCPLSLSRSNPSTPSATWAQA